MRGWAFLVLLLVSCRARSTDDGEDEKPVVGSARLELIEPKNVTPVTPFVAAELSTSTSKRCDGFDVPPISEEKCRHLHRVGASADKASLVVERRLSEAPSGGTVEVAPTTILPRDVLVDFTHPDMPTGDSFPWNCRYPATQSGKLIVETGADGRVTFRFDRLLMSNFRKTRSFVLTGELVLDCTAGAGTATCASRSGTARP